MLRGKKLILMVIIIILLIMAASISLAQEKQSSGQIDSILIERENGSVIIVPKNDYGIMYILKTGSLYENLLRSDGKLKVVGLVSGEKYIDKNVYGISYILNNGNIANALETAEPIEDDVVATFKELDDLIVSVFNLRVGSIHANIIKNTAEVTIPSDIAQDVITDLQITFSKPVKVTKFNNRPLLSEVKKRLINAGYDPEEYYREFNIKTGWKYIDLAELGNEATLGIITDDDYSINLLIKYHVQ